MYERLYTYVLEVARQGSLKAAADKLYVTPSALSKAIQNLEQELGTPLFDRIGKSFSPTYAGRQFIARAEEIISLHKQLREEIQDIITLHAGRVRVGLQLDAAPQITRAVAQFHRVFPQVEIHVIEDTSANLAKLLQAGEVDLIISNADQQLQQDFRVSVLVNCEMVLVVPRGHPLVKQAIWMEGRQYPYLPLSACKDENFLIPPSGQHMGAFQEGILQDHGITAAMPIRATTIGTLLEMVSEGLGITLTYDWTAKPWENSLNLSLLSFDRAPLCSLSIATNKNRYLGEAVQAFIRTCTGIFP